MVFNVSEYPCKSVHIQMSVAAHGDQKLKSSVFLVWLLIVYIKAESLAEMRPHQFGKSS